MTPSLSERRLGDHIGQSVRYLIRIDEHLDPDELPLFGYPKTAVVVGFKI